LLERPKAYLENKIHLETTQAIVWKCPDNALALCLQS